MKRSRGLLVLAVAARDLCLNSADTYWHSLFVHCIHIQLFRFCAVFSGALFSSLFPICDSKGVRFIIACCLTWGLTISLAEARGLLTVEGSENLRQRGQRWKSGLEPIPASTAQRDDSASSAEDDSVGTMAAGSSRIIRYVLFAFFVSRYYFLSSL